MFRPSSLARRATAAAALAALLLLAGCNTANPPAETTAATDTAAETATESVIGSDTTLDTEGVTDAATEDETRDKAETETEKGPVLYYVCTVTSDPVGTAFHEPYASLSAATQQCDRLASKGYRVVTSEGELAYAPYTEWQCDILRESKWVTDYVRENHFVYGDAPINPAINHDAKKVSCDRLVSWVMYRLGYTDQPRTQGVVVSAMAAWCRQNGFERIVKQEDLQAGDIVLVNNAAHTFIYAGKGRQEGQSYRYDCGSDQRIQSVQPSCEGISGFMCAYRPTPLY